MSDDRYVALSSPSQQIRRAPVRRLLLLRGDTDRESKLPTATLEHDNDKRHRVLTPSTALVHSTTKSLPFLDSDEDCSTVEEKVHLTTASGIGPQNGDAGCRLSSTAHSKSLASAPGLVKEVSNVRETDEVDDADGNSTALRPRCPVRLKLHLSCGARHGVVKEKDTNSLAATGWWSRFLEVDINGCFRHIFEPTLRPLDKHSAGVFYRAMVKAFEGWWQEHWDSLVLSQGLFPGPSQETRSSRGRGRQRKLSSQQVRSQKEENRAQQLHFARVGLASWYESVRVARLMAGFLLHGDSGAAAPSTEATVVGDAQREDTLCGPLQRPWVFEEGCRDAFVAITRISVDDDDMNVNRWVRIDAGNGLVKLYERSDAHTERLLEREIREIDDVHVATVPSPERMLWLLHVLDEAWVHPVAEAFRLPVLECEAPGYYGKICDAASLYSLYADVLRGATLDNMRQGEALKKGHSSKGTILKTSGDEFINYTSLRERFTVLQNNCALYNGIGSELARCAERLVSAARKAIRDAQAEEEGTTLQDSFPWTRRRQEYQHKPHTMKRPSWTAEQLAEAFPPSEVAKEYLSVGKCNETGPIPKINQNEPPHQHPRKPGRDQGVKQLSIVEKTKEGLRVLRLATHSQDDAKKQNAKKGNPDRGNKTKTRKQRRPEAPIITAKKNESVFWVCCDRCDTWRELPQRIDPPPAYWECAYMGLECPKTSERRVVPPEQSEKRERRRSPRVKTSSKEGKRPRIPKRRERHTKRHKSSDSSSSSSSEADDDVDNESASSTSTSSLTSDRLRDIESELERLEAEPVNEDPHGLLERLRLLEKQIDC
ncbi:unnamed protein product [Phytomonas sp. EM1]|nr:unnamed protein product [Phytomonas sp. EM1]|eukprot:CCW64061.1 unnamed protein product [Phytomonas sp. isolate EM1]